MAEILTSYRARRRAVLLLWLLAALLFSALTVSLLTTALTRSLSPESRPEVTVDQVTAVVAGLPARAGGTLVLPVQVTGVGLVAVPVPERDWTVGDVLELNRIDLPAGDTLDSASATTVGSSSYSLEPRHPSPRFSVVMVLIPSLLLSLLSGYLATWCGFSALRVRRDGLTGQVPVVSTRTLLRREHRDVLTDLVKETHASLSPRADAVLVTVFVTILLTHVLAAVLLLNPLGEVMVGLTVLTVVMSLISGFLLTLLTVLVILPLEALLTLLHLRLERPHPGELLASEVLDDEPTPTWVLSWLERQHLDGETFESLRPGFTGTVGELVVATRSLGPQDPVP